MRLRSRFVVVFFPSIHLLLSLHGTLQLKKTFLFLQFISSLSSADLCVFSALIPCKLMLTSWYSKPLSCGPSFFQLAIHLPYAPASSIHLEFPVPTVRFRVLGYRFCLLFPLHLKGQVVIGIQREDWKLPPAKEGRLLAKLDREPDASAGCACSL